jgi:hypothetical protein
MTTTAERDEELGYDGTVGALRGFARLLHGRGEDGGRIAYLMVGEARRLYASDAQLRRAVEDLQGEGVLPIATTTSGE